MKILKISVAVIMMGLLGFHYAANAQQITAEANTSRQGFNRVNFKLDGVSAWYLEPKEALPGKPWIWHSQFPNWHTETDSILLSRGFYVAYINTDDEYGAPKSMTVWDKFYNYLTANKGFAKKVALEGVSRGGLYVYGWAKRNPAKVTCILAEAPVCDFKSWPGAKGKSKGDAKSWAQLQQVYGFKSEQEAMDFDDNPIDNLQGLAAYKVPILHLISNQDHVVPNEENTYKLANNYVRLGGSIQIVPMSRGPQELEGHHFKIETPEKWADFVYNNSYPVKDDLPLEKFISLRNGTPNFKKALSENRTVTVAFLGGSITFAKGWRPATIKYLKEQYPDTKFHFISAGIPSLGSLPHSFRVQRDILDSGKIDLMFMECAVNDRANYTDSTLQVKALEGVIRHAKYTNPNLDIIMMAFADPDKLDDYQKGKIPAEVANQELVAQHYQLPSINLSQMVNDKIKAEEFTWAYDFKDLHPAPYGQELYFASIKKLVQMAMATPTTANNKLPKALNAINFDKGKYQAISTAKLGAGWKITPNWNANDGKEVRDGFFNIPILESSTPGSSFTFAFTGNTVGLTVLSGPDASSITYEVDGGKPQIANYYTKWSNFLHLPWYIVLATGLKEGKHQVKITMNAQVNKEATGNACRIAYFLVN